MFRAELGGHAYPLSLPGPAVGAATARPCAALHRAAGMSRRADPAWRPELSRLPTAVHPSASALAPRGRHAAPQKLNNHYEGIYPAAHYYTNQSVPELSDDLKVHIDKFSSLVTDIYSGG